MAWHRPITGIQSFDKGKCIAEDDYNSHEDEGLDVKDEDTIIHYIEDDYNGHEDESLDDQPYQGY